MGDTLSLVWESDRSCSAARRGGEPLGGRGGIFMLDCKLHHVGALMTDWLVYRAVYRTFNSSVVMRIIKSVGTELIE